MDLEEIFFPWIKVVKKKILKSFPVVKEKTLDILLDHIHEELKNLDWNDTYRAEILYETLNYFHLHFTWKVNWNEESYLQLYCAQLLYYITYVTLILSSGNVQSPWLNKAVSTLNFFSDNCEIVCDILLLIRNIPSKYLPAYREILSSILIGTNIRKSIDAECFIKIMLLCRRLKSLITVDDTDKRTDIYNLASKVKCPDDTINFLSTVNNNGDGCCFTERNIFKKFLNKNLKSSFIKNLFEILFRKRYSEKLLNFSASIKRNSKSISNISVVENNLNGDRKNKLKQKIKKNIAKEEKNKVRVLKKSKKKKKKQKVLLEKELVASGGTVRQIQGSFSEEQHIKPKVNSHVDSQNCDNLRVQTREILNCEKTSSKKLKSKKRTYSTNSESVVNGFVSNLSSSRKSKKRKTINVAASYEGEDSKNLNSLSDSNQGSHSSKSSQITKVPSKGLISQNKEIHCTNDTLNREVRSICSKNALLLNENEEDHISERIKSKSKNSNKKGKFITSSSPVFSDRTIVSSNLHKHNDNSSPSSLVRNENDANQIVAQNENFVLVDEKCICDISESISRKNTDNDIHSNIRLKVHVSPNKVIHSKISVHDSAKEDDEIKSEMPSNKSLSTSILTKGNAADYLDINKNIYNSSTPPHKQKSRRTSESTTHDYKHFTSPESLDLNVSSVLSESSKPHCLEKSQSIYSSTDDSFVSLSSELQDTVNPKEVNRKKSKKRKLSKSNSKNHSVDEMKNNETRNLNDSSIAGIDELQVEHHSKAMNLNSGLFSNLLPSSENMSANSDNFKSSVKNRKAQTLQTDVKVSLEPKICSFPNRDLADTIKEKLRSKSKDIISTACNESEMLGTSKRKTSKSVTSLKLSLKAENVSPLKRHSKDVQNKKTVHLSPNKLPEENVSECTAINRQKAKHKKIQNCKEKPMKSLCNKKQQISRKYFPDSSSDSENELNVSVNEAETSVVSSETFLSKNTNASEVEIESFPKSSSDLSLLTNANLDQCFDSKKEDRRCEILLADKKNLLNQNSTFIKSSTKSRKRELKKLDITVEPMSEMSSDSCYELIKSNHISEESEVNSDTSDELNVTVRAACNESDKLSTRKHKTSKSVTSLKLSLKAENVSPLKRHSKDMNNKKTVDLSPNKLPEENVSECTVVNRQKAKHKKIQNCKEKPINSLCNKKQQISSKYFPDSSSDSENELNISINEAIETLDNSIHDITETSVVLSENFLSKNSNVSSTNKEEECETLQENKDNCRNGEDHLASSSVDKQNTNCEKKKFRQRLIFEFYNNKEFTPKGSTYLPVVEHPLDSPVKTQSDALETQTEIITSSKSSLSFSEINASQSCNECISTNKQEKLEQSQNSSSTFSECSTQSPNLNNKEDANLKKLQIFNDCSDLGSNLKCDENSLNNLNEKVGYNSDQNSDGFGTLPNTIRNVTPKKVYERKQTKSRIKISPSDKDTCNNQNNLQKTAQEEEKSNKKVGLELNCDTHPCNFELTKISEHSHRILNKDALISTGEVHLVLQDKRKSDTEVNQNECGLSTELYSDQSKLSNSSLVNSIPRSTCEAKIENLNSHLSVKSGPLASSNFSSDSNQLSNYNKKRANTHKLNLSQKSDDTISSEVNLCKVNQLVSNDPDVNNSQKSDDSNCSSNMSSPVKFSVNQRGKSIISDSDSNFSDNTSVKKINKDSMSLKHSTKNKSSKAASNVSSCFKKKSRRLASESESDVDDNLNTDKDSESSMSKSHSRNTSGNSTNSLNNTTLKSDSVINSEKHSLKRRKLTMADWMKCHGTNPKSFIDFSASEADSDESEVDDHGTNPKSFINFSASEANSDESEVDDHGTNPKSFINFSASEADSDESILSESEVDDFIVSDHVSEDQSEQELNDSVSSINLHSSSKSSFAVRKSQRIRKNRIIISESDGESSDDKRSTINTQRSKLASKRNKILSESDSDGFYDHNSPGITTKLTTGRKSKSRNSRKNKASDLKKGVSYDNNSSNNIEKTQTQNPGCGSPDTNRTSFETCCNISNDQGKAKSRNSSKNKASNFKKGVSCDNNSSNNIEKNLTQNPGYGRPETNRTSFETGCNISNDQGLPNNSNQALTEPKSSSNFLSPKGDSRSSIKQSIRNNSSQSNQSVNNVAQESGKITSPSSHILPDSVTNSRGRKRKYNKSTVSIPFQNPYNLRNRKSHSNLTNNLLQSVKVVSTNQSASSKNHAADNDATLKNSDDTFKNIHPDPIQNSINSNSKKLQVSSVLKSNCDKLADPDSLKSKEVLALHSVEKCSTPKDIHSAEKCSSPKDILRSNKIPLNVSDTDSDNTCLLQNTSVIEKQMDLGVSEENDTLHRDLHMSDDGTETLNKSSGFMNFLSGPSKRNKSKIENLSITKSKEVSALDSAVKCSTPKDIHSAEKCSTPKDILRSNKIPLNVSDTDSDKTCLLQNTSVIEKQTDLDVSEKSDTLHRDLHISDDSTETLNKSSDSMDFLPEPSKRSKSKIENSNITKSKKVSALYSAVKCSTPKKILTSSKIPLNVSDTDSDKTCLLQNTSVIEKQTDFEVSDTLRTDLHISHDSTETLNKSSDSMDLSCEPSKRSKSEIENLNITIQKRKAVTSPVNNNTSVAEKQTDREVSDTLHRDLHISDGSTETLNKSSDSKDLSSEPSKRSKSEIENLNITIQKRKAVTSPVNNNTSVIEKQTDREVNDTLHRDLHISDDSTETLNKSSDSKDLSSEPSKRNHSEIENLNITIQKRKTMTSPVNNNKEQRIKFTINKRNVSKNLKQLQENFVQEFSPESITDSLENALPLSDTADKNCGLFTQANRAFSDSFECVYPTEIQEAVRKLISCDSSECVPATQFQNNALKYSTACDSSECISPTQIQKGDQKNSDSSEYASLTQIPSAALRNSEQFLSNSSECASLAQIQNDDQKNSGTSDSSECASLTQIQEAGLRNSGTFNSSECASLIQIQNNYQKNSDSSECVSLTQIQEAALRNSGTSDSSECVSLTQIQNIDDHKSSGISYSYDYIPPTQIQKNGLEISNSLALNNFKNFDNNQKEMLSHENSYSLINPYKNTVKENSSAKNLYQSVGEDSQVELDSINFDGLFQQNKNDEISENSLFSHTQTNIQKDFEKCSVKTNHKDLSGFSQLLKQCNNSEETEYNIQKNQSSAFSRLFQKPPEVFPQNESPCNDLLDDNNKNSEHVITSKKDKENLTQDFLLDSGDERLLCSHMDKYENDSNSLSPDSFLNDFFGDNFTEQNLTNKVISSDQHIKPSVLCKENSVLQLKTKDLSLNNPISTSNQCLVNHLNPIHDSQVLQNVPKAKCDVTSSDKSCTVNTNSDISVPQVDSLNLNSTSSDETCFVNTNYDILPSQIDASNLDPYIELFRSDELTDPEKNCLFQRLNQMGFKMKPEPRISLTQNSISECIQTKKFKSYSETAGKSHLKQSTTRPETSKKVLVLLDVDKKSCEFCALPEAVPFNMLNKPTVTHSESQTDINDSLENIQTVNENIDRTKKVNDCDLEEFIVVNGTKLPRASFSPFVNIGRRCDEKEIESSSNNTKIGAHSSRICQKNEMFMKQSVRQRKNKLCRCPEF